MWQYLYHLVGPAIYIEIVARNTVAIILSTYNRFCCQYQFTSWLIIVTINTLLHFLMSIH